MMIIQIIKGKFEGQIIKSATNNKSKATKISKLHNKIPKRKSIQYHCVLGIRHKIELQTMLSDHPQSTMSCHQETETIYVFTKTS